MPWGVTEGGGVWVGGREVVTEVPARKIQGDTINDTTHYYPPTPRVHECPYSPQDHENLYGEFNIRHISALGYCFLWLVRC